MPKSASTPSNSACDKCGKYCTWTNIARNDIDANCTNKNTLIPVGFRLFFCVDTTVSDRQYINLLMAHECVCVCVCMYGATMDATIHFGCCVCTNPRQFHKPNYLRLIAEIWWCDRIWRYHNFPHFLLDITLPNLTTYFWNQISGNQQEPSYIPRIWDVDPFLGFMH